MFSKGLMAVFVLCATFSFAQSAAAQVMRSARETALVSAVQVRVETHFGTHRRCSGYLFNTQGQVITSYSGVSDAKNILIYQADLGVLEVTRIRRIDERSNIAVLMVAQRLPGEMAVANLGEGRDLGVGETVNVLHHAERSDAVLHACKVEAVGYAKQFPASPFTEGYTQDQVLLQVSGPFDAGSLGALVCDESWNAVGLIVGGGPVVGGKRVAYVLTSNSLAGYFTSSFDTQWANLRTGKKSDAEFFDKFFGPAVQRRGFQAPMREGYVCWFAPMYPAAYNDADFTAEINDKVKKNWFASTGIVLDGKPLREISGSRVVIWEAANNPWGTSDGADRYVNFDADSLFSKRVYRDRQTEERIMTRHILAIGLEPGSHVMQYENKGANFKSSGIKRANLNLAAGTVKLLDINGLSLVQMDRLPPPPAALAGEKNAVKYELTRRPLTDTEVVFGIRSGWFEKAK